MSLPFSSSFSSSPSASSLPRHSLFYVAVEAGSLDKINEAMMVVAAAESGRIDAVKDAINFLNNDQQFPGWKEKNYAGIGRGNSALHLACWKGLSRDIIERLLELGADVNLKSSGDGYTALSYASSKGHRDLVELLLNRGADILMKTNEGYSALYCASSCGHKNVVKLLLHEGADVHAKDNEGVSALLLASAYGRIDIAELLLDGGARMRDKSDNGWNALHYACLQGRKYVLQLLLYRDGNIHDKDIYKRDAIDFAKQSMHDNGTLAILTKWPVTMWIVVMQDLMFYHQLDCDSTQDFFQFIGF
jgi:hypothetical protein